MNIMRSSTPSCVSLPRPRRWPRSSSSSCGRVDWNRGSSLENLPSTDVRIARERGFLIVPPGAFGKTDDIVREAQQALKKFDATPPPAGKNRKRFLQNVLDASTLTHESAAVRFA